MQRCVMFRVMRRCLMREVCDAVCDARYVSGDAICV
jgi:hypothetical protein